MKNQFRSLDDEEVSFLDSVLESTRAKEAEVRRETEEQLEVFRKQREAAEKAQFEEDNAAVSSGTANAAAHREEWAARPKKRRRDKDAAPSLGSKLRKMSSADAEKPDQPLSEAMDVPRIDATILAANESKTDAASKKGSEETVIMQKSPATTALGLEGYSSDED